MRKIIINSNGVAMAVEQSSPMVISSPNSVEYSAQELSDDDWQILKQNPNLYINYELEEL